MYVDIKYISHTHTHPTRRKKSSESLSGLSMVMQLICRRQELNLFMKPNLEYFVTYNLYLYPLLFPNM